MLSVLGVELFASGYPPAPGLESGEPFAVLRRMIDQAEAQFRAWPSPAPALWVLAQHRTQHSAQHQPQHPAQHQVQHSSSVPCSRSADSIRLSIRCDVTGFRPQDLHVRLGASVLTLSGQRAASSAGPQLQLRETLWVPAAEFDQQKVRSYMEGSWLNVVVPRHSAGAHNSTEIPIQVS